MLVDSVINIYKTSFLGPIERHIFDERHQSARKWKSMLKCGNRYAQQIDNNNFICIKSHHTIHLAN